MSDTADLDIIRGLLNVNDLVSARLALHSRRITELEDTIAELRDQLHEVATKLERQQNKTILQAVAEVTEQ